MERNSQADRTGAAMPSARGYREHQVPHGPNHLYARDYPGTEPAVVLLHGFPDNLHLYDRLVPELAARRVVAFDFLGWGASDKPTGYRYTAANQIGRASCRERVQISVVGVPLKKNKGAPRN